MSKIYQNDKKKYILKNVKFVPRRVSHFSLKIKLHYYYFSLTEFCTIYNNNNNNILWYMYIAVQHKYIH